MKALIQEIKTIIRAVTKNKPPAKRHKHRNYNKETNKKQGEPKVPHYQSRLDY